MLIIIIPLIGAFLKIKFDAQLLSMQKLLRLTACIFFVFMVKHASSQGNYIRHTLKTGETLSALAKQYNTNVGDIMRMNGMHADSKLVYGSVIKIPSTKANAVSAKTNTTKTQETQTIKQDVAASTSNNIIKHTVVKGETLYSISKKYNVSIEQLKAWNHLTDNGVDLGSSLIVGNTTVASAPSDTKRQRVETIQQTTTQPQQEKTFTSNVAEQTKTDNAVIKTNDVSSTNQSAASEKSNVISNASFAQNGPGYFEDQFNTKGKHKKHVSGVSKTFKTASGWNDGKYYILADNINPGTIVKLTADNGKSVYAKVLWNMSDLKEGNDVDFRVSNATAAALNENNPSFNLTVNY